MAVFRKIETSFWQDTFVLNLTPEEKYFYLYLMTNTKTSQCGIYEIPKKIMEMETGYNTETVDKLIKRFVEYGKVIYSSETDEIMLVNWVKYNGSSSPRVITRVETELKEIKNRDLVEKYISIAEAYGYKLDTVSILYPYSIDTEPQKEKEEAEAEAVEDELAAATLYDDGFKSIIKAFAENIHPPSPIEAERLSKWLDDMEADVIMAAIEEAVVYNRRNIKYIEGILNNWLSSNVKTKLDLDAYKRDWQDKKQKSGQASSGLNKTTDFGKFEQHEISEEQLESLFEDFG